MRIRKDLLSLRTSYSLGKDRDRNRAVHSGLAQILVTLQNQHQPHINLGGKLRQNCDQEQPTGIWDFKSWNVVQVVVF